ncbi:urea transporter [Micrococcoides hystricis]|uniref:Urea transporter n=1 Tax=Micrococcoides hystricis TaxID=1572761 RepID=A0ABV6P9K3_9MICC
MNSTLSQLRGAFTPTQRLHERSAFLGTIDSTFRGIGQVIFINNPLSGLIFALAIFLYRPWAGLLFVAGSYACTLFAHLLDYPLERIRSGIYTFNGSLVSLLLANFLTPQWNFGILIYAIIAAAISVPLMHAGLVLLTERLGIPTLSLPFSLVGLTVLLLIPTVAYGYANHALLSPVARVLASPNVALRPSHHGDPVPFAEGVVQAIIRGVSETFLLNSPLVGILVLVGILLSSTISAAAALVGSTVGAGLGLLLGADGYQIFGGLWGYTGALAAVCLFGPTAIFKPTWSSGILAIVTAACAAFLFGSLGQYLAPLGVVPLSLPFVLVTMAAVLAAQGSSRFSFNADRG